MHLSMLAGTTSKIIPIPVYDSSSTVGGMLTGLVFNTASLVCWYNREGAAGAANQISLLTATKGTWTTAGFVPIDGTNMPGWYELHVPNAALAAGAKSVSIQLRGAANMVPVNILIQLTTWDDQTALSSTTIGTATNLTNAPGAGDFTAAMKTSLNAATVATVTNLTNAPTAGDLTAAMKTSVENAVWDAARSSHVATGVFGQLGQEILRDNTATAGAASTITLDAGASTTVDLYKGDVICIYSGTGAGQARVISAYSAGRVATVVPAWVTTPDATSKFIILSQRTPLVGTDSRVLTSADVSTSGETVAAVTNAPPDSSGTTTLLSRLTGTRATNLDNLDATISGQGNPTGSVATGTNSATVFKTNRTEATDDYWKDALIVLTSGAMSGQVKKISAYNGTTKEVTVSGGFTGTPADGVTFLLVDR